MQCIYVNICMKRGMYVYLICKEGATHNCVTICVLIYLLYDAGCSTFAKGAGLCSKLFLFLCSFQSKHYQWLVEVFFLGGSLNDPSCFFFLFLMISDHRSARSKEYVFPRRFISLHSTVYIFARIHIIYLSYLIYHIIFTCYMTNDNFGWPFHTKLPVMTMLPTWKTSL